MKVSDLIKELQYYETQNPDMPVDIYEWPGKYHSIEAIRCRVGTLLIIGKR